MESRVRAGIDLYDQTLRYAEVERIGSRYRLLRLGSCDFDFDVAHQLLDEAQPVYLETVAEALRDVFSGSSATSFQIAVHPPLCYSFFTALPSDPDSERNRRRVEQEIELVTGASQVHGLHFTADHVVEEVLSDGRTAEWYHVLALGSHVHDRIDQVLHELHPAEFRVRVSMDAAAEVAATLIRKATLRGVPIPHHVLAIGWYPSHVEFVLLRDGRWQFSHFAEIQSPHDTTYFALALLERLKLDTQEIDELYTYGAGFTLADPGLIGDAFGKEVQTLNPVEIVSLDPASLSTSFDAGAYVSCIGVAL